MAKTKGTIYALWSLVKGQEWNNYCLICSEGDNISDYLWTFLSILVSTELCLSCLKVLLTKSQNQQIIWIWRDPYKGHLVQLLHNAQGHDSSVRLLRAWSSLAWNVFRDRASTTFLGNPFQYPHVFSCNCFFSPNLTILVRKDLGIILFACQSTALPSKQGFHFPGHITESNQ